MRCEEDISGGSWILCPEDAGLHCEVHSIIADRDLGEGGGLISRHIGGVGRDKGWDSRG